MGQFKPMVKMETTEPSVILKLKKGGHVGMKSKGENGHSPMKKMDGGVMGALAGTPALVGRPAVNAPVASPGRPSMMARRKAMQMSPAALAAARSTPAVAPTPMMKKGGKAKAKGGEVETPAMHKMEMKGIKGIGKELKSHESKPASKAHAGLKTGGVVKGQGGYATGGVVNGQGGFKTGGVVNGQGGFKKGGGVKKFADGGLIDTGRAVKMPEGRKKPSEPVSTIRFAGTFKKGGSVKRLNGGGDAQSDKETKGYNNTYSSQKADNTADRNAVLPDSIWQDVKDAVGTHVNAWKGLLSGDAMRDKDFTPFPSIRRQREAREAKNAPGAITKTQESVTVAPAKKRGGMAC